MSVITKFETPAALRDASIDSTFYTDWHDVVRSLIDDHVPMSGRGRSVDPSRVDLAVREQRVFTWTGFPRPLSVRHRDDRQAAFRAADADRGVQIEYLEWAVTRNDDNTIVRVDFTCETPEYYRTLADTNRDQLLATYRRLVGDSVSTDNLFTDGGSYLPQNKWNGQRFAVHYIMPINSMRDLLGAQQERPTTDGQTPIDARDGFDPLPYRRQTAADARMNWDTWAITRSGHSVATADAPTLYMIDWDDTGFEKPDGTPVGDYWTVIRGFRGVGGGPVALRLRYEVPPSEGFHVGDITIGGRPITTAGQITEHIVIAARIVAGFEQ